VNLGDILGQGESGLPTISTTTGAAVQPPMPSIPVTHAGIFKFGVSGIMGLLGAYYLATGKRESDVQKMLIGGALTLAAMFFF
jgi:hypothetical protein